MRLSVTIFLTILITGCVGQSEAVIDSFDVEQACISLCEAELEKGTDLSAGPCLSNEITPDWVCDVAHSPRQDVDNLPENQCSAFREGKAHHFVEVDENCELIKSR